jgi:hypothetical protein
MAKTKHILGLSSDLLCRSLFVSLKQIDPPKECPIKQNLSYSEYFLQIIAKTYSDCFNKLSMLKFGSG